DRLHSIEEQLNFCVDVVWGLSRDRVEANPPGEVQRISDEYTVTEGQRRCAVGEVDIATRGGWLQKGHGILGCFVFVLDAKRSWSILVFALLAGGDPQSRLVWTAGPDCTAAPLWSQHR